MSLEQGQRNKYHQDGDRCADREAALRLMEDIPDVAPVKKGFGWTVIALFTAFLVLPTLIWGILSLCSPGTAEKLNFDTGENRALAAFPEKFDPATFPAEVEAWYNDHLPFRSVLYKTQETLDNKLEAPYQETLRPALIKLFYGNTPSSPAPGGEQLFDPFEDTESGTASETETLPMLIDTESETLPDFETEEIPSACEHLLSAEGEVLLEATCSSYGVMGYPCTICDYVKKEYIAKAPHSYGSEEVVVEAATCSSYGISGRACTLCGQVGNKQYTHKLPHTLLSDVKDYPLCGQFYDETLRCADCELTETRRVEKTHSQGSVIKVVEPSYKSYGYTLLSCPDCGGEYRTALSDKLYYNDYLPPLYHGPSVTEGRDRWLFYRGDNSEAYYQGTNPLSEDALGNYISILQRLSDICCEKGITLVIGVWPNKDQIYGEYMPSLEVIDPNKRVLRWSAAVEKYTPVQVVYPLRELLAAKPYCDVYLKYDTHWNAAGGYIGYKVMMEALGYQVPALQNLPMKEYAAGGGDMIRIGSLDANIYQGDNYNYTITYHPEVKVTSSGNQATSNGAIDLNFVMLSDSFRGAMRQFIVSDFTESYICHRSEVHDPATEEAIRNADILVISAVERYDQDIINTANKIIQILSQPE